MTPLVRGLASLVAAFALFQATAAPVLAACEQSHETSAPAWVQESSPADISHSGCDGTDTTPAETQHSDDCQASCVAMIGCTTLSFVAVLSALSLPDESSANVALAMWTYRNRSLAPESPPPKA